LILLKKLNSEELSSFVDAAFVSFKWLREFDEDRIKKTLINEISQFEKTIAKGKWILEDLLKNANGKLAWDQIFMLYDTYGFPLEITKEIAAEKGVELDLEWYKKALEKAKEKSRQSTKAMFQKTADWSKYLEGIPATEFVWYW
jgi:alanyl-tRNA synthetase